MTFCYCLSTDLFSFPRENGFFSLSSQRILQFPKKMRRLIFVILDILIHELRSPSNLIHDCFVRVVIAGQLGEIRGFTQERLYLSEEWLHVLQAEIRSPFGLLRDDCIEIVFNLFELLPLFMSYIQIHARGHRPDIATRVNAMTTAMILLPADLYISIY